MPLKNLADWANRANVNCMEAASCGSSDKPKDKPAACGSSCGSSDKPEKKPSACGSSCGASDKPKEKPSACGAGN